MLGEAFSLQSNSNSNGNGKENPKRKSPNKSKKKKKRGGRKKKMTAEQLHALNSVKEWVFLDQPSPAVDDDFGVQKSQSRVGDNIVFDLHSHSIRSDGFLSPSKVVERAHGNGVSDSVFLRPFMKWGYLFFWRYVLFVVCCLFLGGFFLLFVLEEGFILISVLNFAFGFWILRRVFCFWCWYMFGVLFAFEFHMFSIFVILIWSFTFCSIWHPVEELVCVLSHILWAV